MVRPNEAPPSRLSLQLEDTLPTLPCHAMSSSQNAASHVPTWLWGEVTYRPLLHYSPIVAWLIAIHRQRQHSA